MKHRKEQIGDCTLYLGDCLEILPQLAPESVDAIVTDPVYGIEGTWNGGSSNGWGKFSREAKRWDHPNTLVTEFHDFLKKPMIVWGGQYFNLPRSGSWLVWDKMVRQFTSGHCELAWTNLKMPIRAFDCCNAELANEGKVHPTQKPVGLMEWCISHLPDDCETILDPMMGSGTTLVACIKTGRKGIGIEIDERYFDIAVKRVTKAWNEERTSLLTTAAKIEQGELFCE